MRVRIGLRAGDFDPYVPNNIGFTTTLPAGAEFIGSPSIVADGGIGGTITCTGMTGSTSDTCSNGHVSGGGNDVYITFTVNLTTAYHSTTFTEPFSPVTYDEPPGTPGTPGTQSQPVPALTPVAVTQPSPTCVVTAIRRAGTSGHDQEDVTVSDSGGLASVSNVAITNGHVFTTIANVRTRIDPAGTTFTGGPTSVVLTAVKTNQSKSTVWSFQATDLAGNTTTCT